MKNVGIKVSLFKGMSWKTEEFFNLNGNKRVQR